LVVPTFASRAVASAAVSLLNVVSCPETVESRPRLLNCGSFATTAFNVLSIFGVSATTWFLMVVASADENAEEDSTSLVVSVIAVPKFSPATSTSNAPRRSPLKAAISESKVEMLLAMLLMSDSTADAVWRFSMGVEDTNVNKQRAVIAMNCIVVISEMIVFKTAVGTDAVGDDAVGDEMSLGSYID